MYPVYYTFLCANFAGSARERLPRTVRRPGGLLRVAVNLPAPMTNEKGFRVRRRSRSFRDRSHRQIPAAYSSGYPRGHRPTSMADRSGNSGDPDTGESSARRRGRQRIPDRIRIKRDLRATDDRFRFVTR